MRIDVAMEARNFAACCIGWGGWIKRRLNATLICLLIGVALAFGVVARQAQANAATERPTVALWQMHHASWTARDGMPPGVSTMAQSGDGYLWLGSAAGLFRFDGIHFSPYRLRAGSFPASDVRAIQAAPDGGMWISWSLGGASLIKDGVAVNYAEPEGLAIGSIWSFSFDRAGQVWAVGHGGLARFDGKRWHRVGSEQGFTAKSAAALLITRDGTVAAFTSMGLFLMPPGAARFQAPFGEFDVRQPPTQQADGRIYLMDRRGIRLIDSLARADQLDHPWIYRSAVDDNGSMLLDRLGNLWFDSNDALHRSHGEGAVPSGAIGIGPAVESYTAKDGLSGKIIYFLLEDREGNVWISTNGGLDRFRAADVVPIRSAATEMRLESIKLMPLNGAAMAIGSADAIHNWLRAAPDGTLTALSPAGEVMALMRGRDGAIWRASDHDFSVQGADGRVAQIGYPPGLVESGGMISLAQDTSGAVWVSIIGKGVYRYQGGAWTQEPLLPAAGNTPAFSIMADRKGRVWFGYPDNMVAVLEGGKVRLLTQAQGVVHGWTAVLFDAAAQIWAGGTKGLAYYKDGRFVAVLAEPAGALEGISGMAQSADGSLWLNSSAGLVRLAAGELAQSTKAPAYVMQARVFDAADGFSGQTNLLERNSIAVAGDGKVWVSSSAGTFWVDPAHLKPSPPAPRAVIQSVNVDGALHIEPALLALPVGAANLQIDYTATGLATPERSRFRYRLDGYDPDWQQAGARRQAFYTKVPPGNYVFRISAATAGGAWRETGGGLQISIPPAFYQQWWFRLLWLAAGLLSLYCAYRWRVRLTLRRLQELTRERLQERERIARALHDTFLQSVYGLVLRFQSVARHLPADGQARQVIEAALVDADATLVEGRSQVLDLRSSIESVDDLPQALISAGLAFEEIHGVLFLHEVKGERAVLMRQARDEIYHLGREALSNAYRHAAATSITLEMDFRPSGLRLVVYDNGIGITPPLQAARAVPGHWGLAGMRERAQALRASLELDSQPGKTELSVFIPARQAYRYPYRRWLWWTRRK